MQIRVRLTMSKDIVMNGTRKHMCDLSQTSGQPRWPYVCFALVTLVIGLNAKGAAP